MAGRRVATQLTAFLVLLYSVYMAALVPRDVERVRDQMRSVLANSRLWRLRRVILHRPDLELKRLTPSN